MALTRAAIGWNWPPFVIPEQVYELWDHKARGDDAEGGWNARFAAYRDEFPELAAELQRRMRGELPKHFAQTAVDAVIAAHTKAETVASRKASQIALEAFTQALPEMLGGSADLTGSNLTNTSSTPALRFGEDGTPNGGRHINYGVREFGMAAVMNGIALHGGFIPYGGTFLTFSDYSRNAIRMAALMKHRVIHVFTHDSIGLGEDGPTHQSVEHAAALRLIPGLDVWRPGDTAETAVAWTVALSHADRPSALLLSRQNLAYAPKSGLDEIAKGGYVLAEPSEVGLKRSAQAAIIATGSEVQLALHAQAELAQGGIAVRVVSMPSTSVFDRQSIDYKTSVLPPKLPRIAVEAGVTDGWWKYGCAAGVAWTRYGQAAPRRHCQAVPFRRRRTWPTPCARGWPAEYLVLSRLLQFTGDRIMAIKVGINGFGASGAWCSARRCRTFRRHRDRRHQRPARTRLPGLHAASTTACTAASRARSRSTASTSGRQRQAHPPDRGSDPANAEVGRGRRRHRGRVAPACS